MIGFFTAVVLVRVIAMVSFATTSTSATSSSVHASSSTDAIRTDERAQAKGEERCRLAGAERARSKRGTPFWSCARDVVKPSVKHYNKTRLGKSFLVNNFNNEMTTAWMRVWKRGGWKQRFKGVNHAAIVVGKTGPRGKSIFFQTVASSSLGGTKATQQATRAAFARGCGCVFNDMKISPESFDLSVNKEGDRWPVNILQRTFLDWALCFSQPWPGFSFPRIALFHGRLAFAETPGAANRSWIVKASEGFHGQDMRVWPAHPRSGALTSARLKRMCFGKSGRVVQRPS